MAEKTKKQSFGVKLKVLRERQGLSIEDLAEQVNMKPSYLKGLEADKYLPHVAEILTLASTLSVEASSFMEDESLPKTSPGKRKKAHTVRARDYAYETLTPFERDAHLTAYRVTIDPHDDHRKVGYEHEGEEFIYVLSGKLTLKVDKKTTTLGPGESMRFDSGKKHVLKNPGEEPTQLIVVLYTP